MPIFMMAPGPVPDNFTWRGTRFHLTYPTHISPKDLVLLVGRRTSIAMIGWSVAHEDTTTERDGVTIIGYKHTHFAMIFASRLQLKGSRAFDVTVPGDADDIFAADNLHPNIQPKVSAAQMVTIFTEYHAGRKFDIETGRLAYKAPVLHEYHLPPMFDFHRYQMAEIIAAPDLLEACIAADVKPRSVNDVQTLRAESASTSLKTFHHKFGRDTFLELAPRVWDVLWVHGATNLGKTKWATAQFRNPCMIKPFDSIGCLEALSRLYDASLHDGLVLDEADLRFMTRAQVIAFFDPDEPCTLDVRYRAFTLPAGVKKIVISNPAPTTLCPPCQYGAVARRFQTLEVTAKTYGLRAPVARLPLMAPNAVESPMTAPAPFFSPS